MDLVVRVRVSERRRDVKIAGDGIGRMRVNYAEISSGCTDATGSRASTFFTAIRCLRNRQTHFLRSGNIGQREIDWNAEIRGRSRALYECRRGQRQCGGRGRIRVGRREIRENKQIREKDSEQYFIEFFHDSIFLVIVKA